MTAFFVFKFCDKIVLWRELVRQMAEKKLF